MAFDNLSSYQDLFGRILGNTGANGFRWDQNNTSSKLQQMGQQFSGMFQNMMGRAPSDQEMNSMFQNVGGAVGSSSAGFAGTDYAGMQNIMNPYIQNTYGPQIQQNQQQQQQTQLQGAESQIQNLIQKQMGATVSDLTNPNSPTYQAFAGNMNNLGITPSSGAFQAGLGGAIGQAAAGDTSAALGAVGLPAISGQMQTAQAPYQMSLNNMYPGLSASGSRNNDLYDFSLQTDLAQRLQNQAEPSGFEKGLGYANTASNILGNLGKTAQSGAATSALTSYVCMELIRRGLACDSDLDLLHYHIIPAVFTKARAFWHYATKGRELVEACNRAGVDWRKHRKALLDDVVEQQDPVEATNRYALACKALCMEAAPYLWDERILRTGFWDSLPFLPRVLTYGPFLRVARKVFRMRQMFLLDLPLSRID